jgi:decaprenylphospho-beta-D-ribofuranose 2-oxidase
MVAEWNRVYGPHGFLQYQLVVPFKEAETFRRCLEMIVNSGHLSCLNVLKRFGPGNPSPLSFPMPGWTLTVDLPIEHGLDKLCDTLDTEVVGAGGRVYLAKDVHVSLQMARRRELGPRRFLREYLRQPKARAIFARDDPLPAVASLAYLRSRTP